MEPLIDDGDHSAAGAAFHAEFGHLLLQGRLHLLRLLHHLLDVHRVSDLHLLDVPDFRREHFEKRLHPGIGKGLFLESGLLFHV